MGVNTMAKNTVDVSTLSVADIEALLRAKKEEQAKIAAEKGLEARKDVERYLQEKWGLTLTQVWMANGKPSVKKTYKNPADGKTYTYSGKGKVPAWLKDSNGKPNPAFEVKSN
jgi:DNA-binding protein H-NS